MTNFVHAKANAKLNLYLEVLGKRQDGYHALRSIFQAVPLYDELKVYCIAGKCECKVVCESFDLPKDNTLTKAYNGFCSCSNIDKSVCVELEKKIPSGAGLGGGSSDAAAFLLSLNELFGNPLSSAELYKIALTVGSDVPFFLFGKCAVVTGRGEKVYPIPSRKDLSFVLVYPEIHSSTAKAYELVDVFASEKKILFNSTDDFGVVEKKDEQLVLELKKVYNQNVFDWNFFNSFTEPLIENYPKIKEIICSLKTLGADFAEMTGSGSAVFGVFQNDVVAKDAYKKLCNNWQYCYCLRSSDL